MKITYIKWLDAAGTDQNVWQDIEALPGTLIEIHTAGIVVSEDEQQVTVVASRSEVAFMGDITIPKVGIIYRKDFTVGS